MPAREDLGFLVLATVVTAVICLYARRRWQMSVERAAEVRRLAWLAVEEAARAELDSEALVYVAPGLITFSSLSEDDGGANGVSVVRSQCAVCYRRTSTRCSRCKAVRYCSGKCQIMHWRQGHKDNCHPPKIDHGNKHGEGFSSSKILPTSNYSPLEYSVQIETSAPCKHPVETSCTESSHKSNSSSAVSGKDHYSAQPVVDGHGTESISDLHADSSSPMSSTSSSFSSSSAFSKHLLTQDDASSYDEPHVLDSGEKETPCINNFGGDRTAYSDECLSYTNNIKPKIHSSNTNNSKISLGVCTGSSFTGSETSTKRPFLATASTKNDASPSKKQSTTQGTSNSLLKEKNTRPRSSLFYVNHESSNDMLSRKDNVPGLITKSAVNTDSVPNGISDMKTSVKRAVQQLKFSHLSKHSSGIITAVPTKRQMLFPYELFVKLYNCDKVDMRPCGLTNCGNSCYANAVLQCLAFTRPLTSYLLQGYHARSCPKRGWCFTCEFASLLAKAMQGQSPLSPFGILSQIHNIGSNLGQGRQEDAHEFLRYAIEAMQLVCLKEAGIYVAGKFTEATTFIQMIFGGYLRSKIKCMRCRRTSECNEQMMDLAVEIHGDIVTLEEALARFTATEILDEENRYECVSCKSYERAKKKLTILEAPNVLTIALKRFQSQSGKFGKLNKAVRFPETLDLDPYMSCTSDRSNVYSLYAVVVHEGFMNAASSGHYICYVKSIQNKWYKTDDSKVKSVDIGKVLANNAYMLFYARCSPQPPCSIESMSSHNHQKHKSSKLHSHQPINLQTANNIFNQKLPYSRTDSSSDISSIFSLSDEGSCSTTDSTGDSTSTEELSEYIFGRCSSSVLSEDSDFGSIISPFVELERRDSPQILYSDSRKLTEDSYYRGSRETDMVFRRSNATRERRDQVL